MLDSRPGLYRNVLVFDFKSLYPSLIRTFNIDPLTHVPSPAPGADVIRTPERRGASAATSPASCPRWWRGCGTSARPRARPATRPASQAIKILMNSLFGVLGSPASRLFSPAVANAITLAGQHVIRLAAAGRRAPRAIASSTATPTRSSSTRASRTTRARAATAETPARRGRRRGGGGAGARVRRARATSSSSSRRSTRASSCPRCAAARRAARSATPGSSDGRLEIVGLEAVRRDWSDVARRFQRELLDRVLRDQPVDGLRARLRRRSARRRASTTSSPTGRPSGSRSTRTRRRRRRT